MADFLPARPGWIRSVIQSANFILKGMTQAEAAEEMLSRYPAIGQDIANSYAQMAASSVRAGQQATAFLAGSLDPNAVVEALPARAGQEALVEVTIQHPDGTRMYRTIRVPLGVDAGYEQLGRDINNIIDSWLSLYGGERSNVSYVIKYITPGVQ